MDAEGWVGGWVEFLVGGIKFKLELNEVFCSFFSFSFTVSMVVRKALQYGRESGSSCGMASKPCTAYPKPLLKPACNVTRNVATIPLA